MNRILLTLFALALSVSAHSQTIFSTSATVTTVERTATFDGISGDLSAYTEDNMIVAVSGTHCCFSDVHYDDGGNTSYVTIKGADDAVFTAIDFVLSDGYFGTPTTNIRWEAYLDGGLTGSGTISGVTKGTVVGWSDTNGFDEVRVAAGTAPLPGFGNDQTVSLDDLRAEVGAIAQPVPVPTIGIWGVGMLSGLIGLLGVYHRRRK